MRCTLLIYQNTEARNGLSQENEDVFMHSTGDILAARPAAGECVGGQEG